MKNLIILLLIVSTSCKPDEVETRKQWRGELRSFRIDDDGEYHFNTDYNTYSDIYSNETTIIRSNTNIPNLYIPQYRCNPKYTCWDTQLEWQDKMCKYIIELPYNYRIETFDD